ncbi:MAG: glycosyltransferase [Bacteroidetes bacterium]|nr:MAG: glycosyltransferase [Bacteroidota bacterium]
MPLKISVIIPSFNQGKFIEETIRSLLNQNDPALEIIIIDGAGTDNSVEIIKKYIPNLTYWISEPDSGQSDAINKGFKVASGDIITWLGSDDLYQPGALKKVREIFESADQKTGVIFGSTEIFRDNVKLHIEHGSRIQNTERRLSGMTFSQPSSFIRRPYLDLVGPLNTELHYGMDFDLFARLSLICEFKRVDFCFSKYRIHDASKSGSNFDRFGKEWMRVFTSIAKGLSAEYSIKELTKLNLIAQPLPATEEFFARHGSISKLDEELMLFFFISNMFFHSYLSGRFSQAKVLARYLKDFYPEKLKLLPEINLIHKRSLKYSSIILKAARKLKSSLIR